jgi:succinate-semialdehyde dehydrogenase/glutarate-semialdehyde dehydrogenase
MSKTAVGVELQDARLFRQACYVDGAWTEAREVIEVDNPATGEIIGTGPKLGRAETERAIDAASRAFPAWRRKTARERAAVMRRWFELMLASQDDLARLMTIEQGKPLTESKGEVVYAASFLEWFGEEAKRAYGDTIPNQQPDKRLVVVKEPIGVVACITPWNFPLAMITRKAGPAIASGARWCSSPRLRRRFRRSRSRSWPSRAGVPPGVFNVITGSATEIGAELTSNPIVRKLSFTGSTETGKVLMAQCAATVKNFRSSSAATRRSSSSTMRTSTRQSRARWRRSTATPGRRASAPTACSSRTASTIGSPPSWPRR